MRIGHILTGFLERVRWGRFVVFTGFMVGNVRLISVLQHSDSAAAEWVVGSLALVPSLVIGLLLLRAIRPRASHGQGGT